MHCVDPGSPELLGHSVRAGFEEVFGGPPTLVGAAPGRVNLIGEHTDYNAGLCLPVALPHATYAALRPRADDRVQLVSRQSTQGWQGRLDEIGPGAPEGWPAYVAGVLWALRERGLPVPGLDCFLDSTVPVGAGLSSSAALECAVAVGVVDLLGLTLDDTERAALVTACMRAETEVAGAPTGGLDQSIALFGQAEHALLLDFASGARHPVPLGLGEAGLRLLVIDTQVSHALVDGGYAARRADCEEAARQLGVPSLRRATGDDIPRLSDPRLARRARHVVTEIARVERAVDAIAARDWSQLGRIFAESHTSLRDDYEVSCPELDLAVATAVDAGALGARMTGGGFGGSAVAIVPDDSTDSVASAVAGAFARAAHHPPQFLLADPSAGARVQG